MISAIQPYSFRVPKIKRKKKTVAVLQKNRQEEALTDVVVLSDPLYRPVQPVLQAGAVNTEARDMRGFFLDIKV